MYHYTPPHVNKKTPLRNETLEGPHSKIRKQEILRPSPADGCFCQNVIFWHLSSLFSKKSFFQTFWRRRPRHSGAAHTLFVKMSRFVTFVFKNRFLSRSHCFFKLFGAAGRATAEPHTHLLSKCHFVFFSEKDVFPRSHFFQTFPKIRNGLRLWSVRWFS